MPRSNDLEKLVGPQQPDGVSFLDPIFRQKGKLYAITGSSFFLESADKEACSRFLQISQPT